MWGIPLYSIVSWLFFFISVLGAMALTSFRHPWVHRHLRRHRKLLLSTTLSSLFLGIVSSTLPFFFRTFNPDASKLVPFDQLVLTEYSEPLENPTDHPTDESFDDSSNDWTKKYPAKFRFKLKMPYSFKHYLAAYEHRLFILDEQGTLRGFDAYTGLNHFSIPLKIQNLVSASQEQDRLFILDHNNRTDVLRLTCINLQNPSAIWQRTFPNSRQGAFTYHADTQTLLVTASNSGVWLLRSKTGEIFWKRPDLYSYSAAFPVRGQWIIFEPKIAKKLGRWSFLSDTTGKTLKTIPHTFDSLQEWVSDSAPAHEPQVIAVFKNEDQSQTLARLNLPNLEPIHSITLQEPLKDWHLVSNQQQILGMSSASTWYSFQADNLQLKIEKKLSDVARPALALSSDQTLFFLPEAQSGVMAFLSKTGEWQWTAQTQDPIQIVVYFGDWFYWFGESILIAHQKLNMF